MNIQYNNSVKKDQIHGLPNGYTLVTAVSYWWVSVQSVNIEFLDVSDPDL